MTSLKNNTYRIKTSLIASSITAFLLSVVMLIQSAAYNDPTPRLAALVAVLIPFYYVFLEILFRRIIVDDQRLIKKTLCTRRVVDASSISRAGRADVKDRTFIVVETEGKRPLLVSNSYDRFGELTEAVIGLAGEDAASDALKKMPRERHRRKSDLINVWMAALVFAAVIAVRFAG